MGEAKSHQFALMEGVKCGIWHVPGKIEGVEVDVFKGEKISDIHARK